MFKIRIKIRSPFFWSPLLVLAVALITVTYSYYYPKKLLFICAGDEARTNSTKKKETYNYSENFLRVYEYAWGLDYSLDNFPLKECVMTMEKSNVVCSTGKIGTPPYAYAVFQLDEGTYFYNRSSFGTTYSGLNFKCKKTLRAIDQ
jgi:hypothetical protein